MRVAALTSLIFLWFVPGLSGSERPAISSRLETALAALADQPLDIWLFFDSTQYDPEPIQLSKRALARRAKVDPVGHLITETDYSLRPELIDSLEQSGYEIKAASRWFKGVVVRTTVDRVEELTQLSGLKRLDLTRQLQAERAPYIVPEPLRKPTAVQLLDYGQSSTQARNAGVTKLHDAGYTGAGVLIAMFDSGFNPNHHAFDSVSLIATYDFINDQVDVSGADCPDDVANHQDRHGTATWSVAGGYLPDTIIGPAYGADFILAKTEITCDGVEIKQEEYNWIRAAEWADSAGADIITASLGYYTFQDSGSYTQSQLDGNSSLITIAADLAASKNILMINSAGNERNNGWGTILFPADGDSVIAVAAMEADSSLAGYSSPGPSADGRVKPDITTQGSQIWAAQAVNDGFYTVQGTSFSAPLLAGSAALVMESGPELTAEEIRQMILRSGDRYDNPDFDFGYGIFNAVRAANILSWPPLGPILLEQNQHRTVDVSVGGRLADQATLELLNPPQGVQFEDLSGGVGRLILAESAISATRLFLELVAAVGQYEDTTSVEIVTYDGPLANALAGPNPFKDSVSFFINHTMASQTATITISLFNLAGEKVREIVNNSTGFAETIVWDGRNSAGKRLAPGIYLVLVQTDNASQQLKLLKTE